MARHRPRGVGTEERLVEAVLTPQQARAARQAAQRYARTRTPWRTPPRPGGENDPVLNEGVIARLMGAVQGRGPEGPRAGRVFHRLRLPAQMETTAQAQGVFPFLASSGLDAPGAFIGSDRFTRGAFTYDPFELYRQGLLSNPNILLAGVIGSGKSSLLKTMVLRLGVFGHRFFVPADTKGEMVALGEAIDANVVPLGPGLKAFNPFYAPAKPSAMPDREYADRIEAHRLLLLSSLGETAQGRPLSAREDLLLELAVRDVTGQLTGTDADRLDQATFPRLVDAMLQPSQAMREEIRSTIGIDYARWRAETEDLALRFRQMVRGSLRGVFDGDSVEIDLAKPGVVIDISRIRASDAAVALTMTCAQALGDLILTFSTSQWIKVLDEVWRQVRYPAILRRISEGQKLARGDDQTTGSATVMAMHRLSDLMGASPEVRELALGLLADTSTRIVYNQASDQLAATQEALSLTDMETDLLPTFGQGQGLWKVGTHSAIVDHRVLREGIEWPLIQTDSRMRSIDEESSESEEVAYRSMEDPQGQMAAEMGASA